MSASVQSELSSKVGPISFGRAIMGQLNVINALILRETRTRFGKHKLGYAWALLEPVMMILTFYLLFTINKRNPPEGMDLLGFLATGIVPYLAFSKCVSQVSQSINGNKGLLFYPQVKPLDVVFARIGLEFTTHFAIFSLLMGANVLVRQEFVIADPLLVVIGLVLECVEVITDLYSSRSCRPARSR